jgi:hypothetical protein
MLGLAGGAAGTGFAAPSSANIQQGVTTDQTNQAYQGVQGAQGQQQALLGALQAQGGLGNQTSVFNQMQGTANQYQDLASGKGPNPAQAMLNQNTGTNIANQAALMAGQRGASSNVGLMARQAAQQGAATQQQAVGQAATMQAQQQIAALQGLSAQQQAMGKLATTEAGQQIGQTNANVQAQQSEQANLLNALGQYNTANVAMQSNVNNANASLAGQQMQQQGQLFGGALQGAAAGIGALAMMAYGGQVKAPRHFADGGFSSMSDSPDQIASDAAAGIGGSSSGSPSSFVGKFLAGVKSPDNPANVAQQQAPQQKSSALEKGGSAMGSSLTSLLGNLGGSAGAGAGADMAAAMAKGGAISMKIGGHVPGKAKHKGDTLKNDTVPAVLSPGEIVLPRSVVNAKNPGAAAAKFVEAIKKRKGSLK